MLRNTCLSKYDKGHEDLLATGHAVVSITDNEHKLRHGQVAYKKAYYINAPSVSDEQAVEIHQAED